MLANFLEKSKPINFIVYLGFFLFFYLTTVFSELFIDAFIWSKALESVYLLLLFFLVFFFYNFVISKNELTLDHSYAFLLFILETVVFMPKLFELKALYLLLIYLLFLRKIYSLHSSKKVIQKLFDSGFWLGILFILEPFSILFILLIYASIFLQRKVTIYNLLTPITGFISPLIIYFTYLFWNDSTQQFTQLFFFDFVNNIFIYAKDNSIWVIGTLFSLSIISIFLKSPKAFSVNNSFKKSWEIIIINFIIAIVFTLTIPKLDGSEIIFITIPTSIIMANGFEVIQKKLIKNILFSALLIGTILTYFLL